MSDGSSRRVWDYRQPISAEDRVDLQRDRPQRDAPYVRGMERGEYGRMAGGRGTPFGGERDESWRQRGGGRFGEGRQGQYYDEPWGDNAYGTYPATGEVMRGDRGMPRGSGRGAARSEQTGQGWPDQSRTPWRDRYDPDDPRTRARLAQAYGVSDVGQLDAQTWQDDENWQRRQSASRWSDAGGRFPESERPGSGGRVAGWPGEDWSRMGDRHPHGRDDAYERFSGAPQRTRWGQGSHAATRYAPKGYQRSDERIREDLCERLAHQRHLDVADVEVQVRDGVVTLSGTVTDRSQKHRIEDMADDTFGVKDVRNELRVERGQGQGGRSESVTQPGVQRGSGEGGHVSGISSSGSATGSSASSYAGGMELGAGEVPKGTDPYGGSTKPQERST